LRKPESGDQASSLRVKVEKGMETVVDVSLPVRSAKWLIDLIPGEVIEKIRAEGIPIDDIQADLASRMEFVPQNIFRLQEPTRIVTVWLE
jgi:hypothetical protein